MDTEHTQTVKIKKISKVLIVDDTAFNIEIMDMMLN